MRKALRTHSNRKYSRNPITVAEPEEKSDNSLLEQAFGVGGFVEIAGDDEEDDRGRRKENARVRPEIQAQLYRDTRLPKFSAGLTVLSFKQPMPRSSPAAPIGS